MVDSINISLIPFNRELSKIVDFDDVLFNKLNELDDKYYNMEDENIFDLLQRYLDNHEW